MTHRPSILTISFRGSPVVGFTGDMAISAELARRLDSTTLKRRLIRRWAMTRLALRSSIPWHRRHRPSEASEMDRARSLLASAAAVRHDDIVAMMVVWGRGDRAARRYVVGLISTEPRKEVFGKWILNPAEDSKWLTAERRLLETSHHAKLTSFRIPRVLGQSNDKTSELLALSAIPPHGSPPQLDELTRIVGRRANDGEPVQASECSWWPLVDPEVLRNVRGLREFLSRRLIATAPAHGDIRLANVVIVDHVPWLFDWEHGALDAPVLADPVGWAINATLTTTPRASAADLLHALRAQLPNQSAVDVIVALLFLSTRENSTATSLLQWADSPLTAETEKEIANAVP